MIGNTLALRKMTSIFSALAAGAFAAKSDVIPMQLRLAYAGDSGMYVSWNAFCHLSEPTVYYGASPSDLCEHTSSNVLGTYLTSTTYNNHVKLIDLRPNTQYYYQPQHSNVSRSERDSP